MTPAAPKKIHEIIIGNVIQRAWQLVPTCSSSFEAASRIAAKKYIVSISISLFLQPIITPTIQANAPPTRESKISSSRGVLRPNFSICGAARQIGYESAGTIPRSSTESTNSKGVLNTPMSEKYSANSKIAARTGDAHIFLIILANTFIINLNYMSFDLFSVL